MEPDAKKAKLSAQDGEVDEATLTVLSQIGDVQNSLEKVRARSHGASGVDFGHLERMRGLGFCSM